MRRRSSIIGSHYTYTVFSNCEGGHVFFDNVLHGVIENGKYTVSILEGNRNYVVSILGGAPNDGSNTETEYTTDYDFSGYTNQSYPYQGGNSSFLLDSSARDATRTKYNPYSYVSPSNATVNRDSSVTMNYSGPHYGTPTYGSWNYGGWYRVGTNWQYNDPSWVSRSASNEGSYNVRWNFSCSANSGSARSDYDQIRQDSGSNQGRVDFSQAVYNPPVYNYTVYSNCAGASVYFDGTHQGTISGGSFSKNITNGDAYYTVTLSGGVPGTSYGNYTYSYVRTPTIISTGMSAAGGSTGDVSTTSYKSRNNTYYDPPGSGRVNANASISLNYTSHSGTEQVYVSWFHNNIPSWLGYTTRTYGTNASPTEKGYYTFAANTGAARSFDVGYTQNESGKAGLSPAAQVAGITNVFTTSRTNCPFTAVGSLVTVNTQSYYASGSTVQGRRPWSWKIALPSWITAQYTIIDNGTASTGTTDKYTASANNTNAARSYNTTMLQQDTGKTIAMSFTQAVGGFTINSSKWTGFWVSTIATPPASSSKRFGSGALIPYGTALSNGVTFANTTTVQVFTQNEVGTMVWKWSGKPTNGQIVTIN